MMSEILFYREIKKKCPNSYKIFDRYYKISSSSDILGDHYPSIKELSRFFDDHNIIVSILFRKRQEDFLPIIDSTQGRIYLFGKISKKRPDAEIEAYRKAFQIMEERIS